MSPGRVVLLTGGREPRGSTIRRDDLVLDAGADAALPAGVRQVAARELLPADEAEALGRRCLEFARGWHVAPGSGAFDPISPARAAESAVLLELGAAMKLLVLLRRLAAREGTLEVVADPLLPALVHLRGPIGDGPVPIVLGTAASPMTAFRRVVRGLRAAVTPGPRGTPGEREGGAARDGAIRIWGLDGYRHRPILDGLEADGRFSLRRFPASAEGRHLPPETVREAPADAVARARESLSDHLPHAERLAASLFGDLPGGAALAVAVAREVAVRAIPASLSGALAWDALLARDRPDAVVGGIPWGGDTRLLALVASRRRVPFVACQDGVLCELGAGGVVAGSAAFTWGPRGDSWFERRGFSASGLFRVGDPWLAALRRSVGAVDPAEVRARLGVPAGRRVLLVGVQNSAPHYLASDPGDPVRSLRALLEGFRDVPGWTLVLKPHPRLVHVDGARRLRLVRELAAPLPAVRVVPPHEPIAGLIALADAVAGEGDTLLFEAVACGKPALLLEHPDLPIPYPEFASTGAMPVVPSAAALREALARGPAPAPADARARLLDEYVRPDTTPADALVELARGSRTAPDAVRR